MLILLPVNVCYLGGVDHDPNIRSLSSVNEATFYALMVTKMLPSVSSVTFL